MTGFFFFSQDERKVYQEQHPGVSAANIAKLLGEKWRNMSE